MNIQAPNDLNAVLGPPENIGDFRIAEAAFNHQPGCESAASVMKMHGADLARIEVDVANPCCIANSLHVPSKPIRVPRFPVIVDKQRRDTW